MDSEGNTATIGKDNSSLKFTGDENVDVAVNDTNNENTVTVSLKDDITLGEKGTNKNYVDLSGTNGTLGVSNVSKTEMKKTFIPQSLIKTVRPSLKKKALLEMTVFIVVKQLQL